MRHSMLTRSKKDKSNESVPMKLTPVIRLKRCDSFADWVQLSGDCKQEPIRSQEKPIQNREDIEPKTPMRSKLKAMKDRFETLKNELNLNGNTKNDKRVAFRLEPSTRVYQTHTTIPPILEPTKQKMSPINPSDVGQFFGFDNNTREFDSENQEYDHHFEYGNHAVNDENYDVLKMDYCDDMHEMTSKRKAQKFGKQSKYAPFGRNYDRNIGNNLWEPEFNQSMQFMSPVVYMAIFGLLMAIVCYLIYNYTNLLKV